MDEGNCDNGKAKGFLPRQQGESIHLPRTDTQSHFASLPNRKSRIRLVFAIVACFAAGMWVCRHGGILRTTSPGDYPFGGINRRDGVVSVMPLFSKWSVLRVLVERCDD